MRGELPAFWRRPVALLIDLFVCFCLTFPVMGIVGAAYLGYFGQEMFGCACDRDGERAGFALLGSLALLPLPSPVYVVWSWTPLSGCRSVGMRVMRIRVTAG